MDFLFSLFDKYIGASTDSQTNRLVLNKLMQNYDCFETKK